MHVYVCEFVSNCFSTVTGAFRGQSSPVHSVICGLKFPMDWRLVGPYVFLSSCIQMCIYKVSVHFVSCLPCCSEHCLFRLWQLCTLLSLQGCPAKVRPTLLVTFECVGKIQWFLAIWCTILNIKFSRFPRCVSKVLSHLPKKHWILPMHSNVTKIMLPAKM